MRLTRFALAALIAVLLAALSVNTVFAVDPPDSLTFEAAGSQSSPALTVYRDLLEDGDLLLLAQYNIAYASLPEDGADVNFIGRVLQNSTGLGTSVPYPYTDSGYGKGLISYYLAATDTADASYTDGSGNWNDWPLTTLGADLRTNPTLFDPDDQLAISVLPIDSSGFSSGSGSSTNKTQLANKILAIARGLEAAWGVSLLTENGRLNSTTGGPYFQLAIPGVLNMAPDAFGASSQSPTVPTPVPTPGSPGTLAETAETRFDAYFWLTPAFDSTGATLGLPAGAFESILSAAVILVITGIGLAVGGQAGAVMGFSVGAGVILPVFTVLGFISWGYGALGISFLIVMGVVKIARDHL